MSTPQSPVSAAGGSESLPEGGRTGETLSARQKRDSTMLARSYATGFRVGDEVITNTPRSQRFHNRRGRVVGTNLGEVGVTFTNVDRADAWFLPAELRRSS